MGQTHSQSDVSSRVLDSTPERPSGRVESILYNLIHGINDQSFDTIIPYIRHVRRGGKTIIETYEIPYPVYVQLLYRLSAYTDASVYHTDEETLTKLVFAEVFDKLSSQDQSTHFKSIRTCPIHLYIYPQRNIVEFNGRRVNYRDKNEFSNEIVDPLIQTLNECGNFAAIAITIRVIADKTPEELAMDRPGSNPQRQVGHANVIFVENIPPSTVDDSNESYSPGNLIFNYYEPHGTKGGFSERLGIDDFLSELEYAAKSYTSQRVIINRKEASCPRGMQSVVGDKIGYCVMFSMFWIYSVLSVIIDMISRDDYRPSITWIKKVETYYLSLDPKYLYTKVVAFAGFLFNQYIAENFEGRQQDVLQTLFGGLPPSQIKPYLISSRELTLDDILERMKQERTEQERMGEIRRTVYAPSYSKDELTSLDDPEQSMEAYERKQFREYDQERTRQINTRSILDRIRGRNAALGESCSNKEMCVSGCCQESKCALIRECKYTIKQGRPTVRTKNHKKKSPYY